jgi:hypothetical protein
VSLSNRCRRDRAALCLRSLLRRRFHCQRKATSSCASSRVCKAAIQSIGVNAAGTLMVTGSEDKTARLWTLPQSGRGSPELLRTLRVPIGDGVDGKVYAVALSERQMGCGWGAHHWHQRLHIRFRICGWTVDLLFALFLPQPPKSPRQAGFLNKNSAVAPSNAFERISCYNSHHRGEDAYYDSGGYKFRGARVNKTLASRGAAALRKDGN